MITRARVLVLLIGLVTLIRIAYALRVELLPEEAYYWAYAQHLDIGYLDHPPMVAWLIRLSTLVLGNTELGVRAGALLCGALASGYLYALTRDLFGAPSARAALVLMQILPFFFAAGLLMTPDAPLTAAWAAMLFYLERALIQGRARAWWGVGIALGAGLLSKYTIALLGLSALALLLLDPQGRRWLQRLQPYGAVALALVIFTPVIVWNAEHQWASFSFQTSRRLAEASRFSLHKLLGAIIVLLTPAGVVALVPLFGRLRASRRADEPPERTRAWRLLALATFIPLGVFTLFSLFHEVKLDWMGAPSVAAVPALAAGIAGMETRFERLQRWLRPIWSATVLLLVVVYAVGFRYLASGFAGAGYGRHPELVPVGWRSLAAQVQRLAHEQVPGPGPALVVGMDRYMIASQLVFYAPDVAQALANTTSAHLFGGIGVMYERWFPAESQRGRNLLLVAWNRADLDTPEVRAAVAELEPIEQGAIRRPDGTLVRPFYYRVALGYRGRP